MRNKNHIRRKESRKKIWKLLAIFPLLFLILAPTPAESSPPRSSVCGAHSKIVENLERNYQEKPRSAGLTANGHWVEILTAPSGTFSIIATTPKGLTCLIATGANWVDFPPVGKPGTGIRF